MTPTSPEHLEKLPSLGPSAERRASLGWALLLVLCLPSCIGESSANDTVEEVCVDLDGQTCQDVPDGRVRDPGAVADPGPDAGAEADAAMDPGSDTDDPPVCCVGAEAWPLVMADLECNQFPGALALPIDQCDDVCCELDDGPWTVLDVVPRVLCLEHGSVRDEPSACTQICCAGELATPTPMAFDDCWEIDGAMALPLDRCDEVCCSVQTATALEYDWAYRMDCIVAGGSIHGDAGLCEEVCCEDEEDGLLQWLPRGTCVKTGNILADDACSVVCCQEWTTATQTFFDDCPPGGSTYALELCDEVCCLLPTNEGAESQFLPAVVCLSYGGFSQPDDECLCGNGVCDPNEDDSTCAEDCGCTALLAGVFGTYEPFCWNHDINKTIKAVVGCRCHHHCWLFGDCCADWAACGMDPPRCGDGACLSAEINFAMFPHVADTVLAFENYQNCPEDCAFQETCGACTPGSPWGCPDFCGCAKPADWVNRDLECLGRDDFCFLTDDPHWCEDRQTFVQPRTPVLCSCDPNCYKTNYCCPDARLTCGLDPPCGDGFCTTSLREHCGTCPQDCGPCPCGDGICRPPSETAASCPKDCFCGDNICHAADGEDRQTCPSDCSCGDEVCSPPYDTHVNCPKDCGTDSPEPAPQGKSGD